MSENNNVETQDITEELMKHTKVELVEMFLKEQGKVKKHKREKADVRVELKTALETNEKLEEVALANDAYLVNLNVQLEKTETNLLNEGQTLQNVVTTLGISIDSAENVLKLARKALQFELIKGEDGKNG